MNLFVTEAPLLQLAGAEILDHHIAFHHQSANDVSPFLRFHVDDDHALVAVRAGPPQGLALVVAADTAQWIALGSLYLDDVGTERSEEHTSELQSLMRISYAVFCFKKKNHNTPHGNYERPTPNLRHQPLQNDHNTYIAQTTLQDC